MRVIIGRNNTKVDEYVLPSSSNLKKQELLFMKGCIIFIILAIVYMCPYKLMQPIQETKGILQNVEECYSPGRGNRSSYLKGLFLTIDNQMYYLKEEYILDDGSRHAVKGIMPMKNALQGKEVYNQEVIISYVKYAHIGSKTDADIMGIEIAGEIWIDSSNSWGIFCDEIILHTVICLFVLVFLVVLYLFRCSFIKVYRTQKV